MFALIMLLIIITVYFVYQSGSDIVKARLKITLSIAVVIFTVWYIVAYASLLGPFKAVINAIREILYGAEVPKLLEGFVAAPLKTSYLYLIVARMLVAVLILAAPTLLIVYLLVRRSLSYLISSLKSASYLTKAFLAIYVYSLIAIYVWVWGKFTGSLRPYQVASPIAIILLVHLTIELLKPNEVARVFRILSFFMVMLALLSPFILWGPNITYVNIPSRDITVIRFLGEYVSTEKEICGISMGYPESWLLSWIYSTRSDIKLRKAIDIRASYHVDMNILGRCGAIIMNGYVLKFNSKYVYTPSLYERLSYVSLQLQEYGYHKIFDCGRFRWLYAH
jgi:hypothetical protein